MTDKAHTNAKATATPAPASSALLARPFAAAPAPDRAAPTADRAAQFGHRFAAVAAQPRASLIVQPKLTLGPVGDKYEQEADRVAAQVVAGMRAPAAQRPQQPLVQRVATAPSAGVAVPSSVEAGIAAARGGGQPLPAETRAQMETAMGADFGGVRVHTDGRADTLNQAVQARAFTTGRDVFFRRGEYQPGSAAGRGVLAHELAHVVQQNRIVLGIIQRTYAKNYAQDAVKRILNKSEGAASPVNNQKGHPRQHVGKLQKTASFADVQQKTKSAYKNTALQDKAVTDALNSANTQNQLRVLDALQNPTRIRIIEDTEPAEVWVVEVSKKSGNGKVRSITESTEELTSIVIIADSRVNASGEIHIQTAYPNT